MAGDRDEKAAPDTVGAVPQAGNRLESPQPQASPAGLPAADEIVASKRERDRFTVTSERLLAGAESPAGSLGETLSGMSQTAARKRPPPVALLVLGFLIAIVLLLAGWARLGPGRKAASVHPTGSSARPWGSFTLSVSSAPSPSISNAQGPAPSAETRK